MEKSLYENTRKESIDEIPCSALMNRDQWENLEQNIAATQSVQAVRCLPEGVDVAILWGRDANPSSGEE